MEEHEQPESSSTKSCGNSDSYDPRSLRPLRPLGGHWQLSELPGEKQNSTSQQTKKQKTYSRLFKAHSETQRLWDFGSKVFIYHRLSYLCVRVWSCMHLCICGHWRLAIRDRTPHSITGNDHKAVLNKIETHTQCWHTHCQAALVVDLSVTFLYFLNSQMVGSVDHSSSCSAVASSRRSRVETKMSGLRKSF